jgi:hypothetical protein
LEKGQEGFADEPQHLGSGLDNADAPLADVGEDGILCRPPPCLLPLRHGCGEIQEPSDTIWKSAAIDADLTRPAQLFRIAQGSHRTALPVGQTRCLKSQTLHTGFSVDLSLQLSHRRPVTL